MFGSTELGASSGWRSQVTEEVHWAKTCGRTRDLLLTAETFPTQLILVGDRASDDEFLVILRECLSDWNFRPPVIGGHDDNNASISKLLEQNFAGPVFAAARGAAILVKAEIESPGGCLESRPYCCAWRGEEEC